jgi:hypothetical protein
MGAFRMAGIIEWLVVITDSQSIDELRMAPENVLSSMVAIDEVITTCIALQVVTEKFIPPFLKTLQVEYTLGDRVSKNPYHIPIIRAQLTRALPQLVPEVQDELQEAFKEYLPPTDGEYDLLWETHDIEIFSRLDECQSYRYRNEGCRPRQQSYFCWTPTL